MEIQEIQATEEPKLNPYSEEKLSPKHLELLFPATFYKSDEDLSLHLTGTPYYSVTPYSLTP